MLRMLFGEQPREWTGLSLETVQSIERFIVLTSELAERVPARASILHKYGIWAEGLLRSLDELEQSIYAAKRFAEQVKHTHIDELSPKERMSYRQHVYYDKNAYIRLFALLDKLGTLLNLLLDLQTERMKIHFSYYTVLRNMRQNGLHKDIMLPLNELKELHREALSRLRDRRNLEIHKMNAEMKDDLTQALARFGERRTLEGLMPNMNDLDQGWEMVQGSINHSFRFAYDLLRKRNLI